MVKWVSIPEYTKQTGLSRGTILKMIERGELIATETDGGGQIRVQMMSDPELDRLNQQIEENNELLKMLCTHLGLKSTSRRLY